MGVSQSRATLMAFVPTLRFDQSAPGTKRRSSVRSMMDSSPMVSSK